MSISDLLEVVRNIELSNIEILSGIVLNCCVAYYYIKRPKVSK